MKEMTNIKYRYASISDKGGVRKNNEDNYYLNGSYLKETDQSIQTSYSDYKDLSDGTYFAVFDGMGGGDYGEVASLTCAEYTTEFFRNKDNINVSDITASLQNYCSGMNEAVFSKGVELMTYMFGSTLVGVYFNSSNMWFINVGDSRSYLIRDSKMKQVSVDHVESYFANPKVSRKPALLQHMGMDSEEIRLEPTITRYEIKSNDRILLCSDGLTDMVAVKRIEEVMTYEKDPSKAVNILYQEAMKPGGIDNITIILIDIKAGE